METLTGKRSAALNKAKYEAFTGGEFTAWFGNNPDGDDGEYIYVSQDGDWQWNITSGQLSQNWLLDTVIDHY